MKAFSMLFMFFGVLGASAAHGAVAVPHTFSAGTPISSSQMNANFAALAAAITPAKVPLVYTASTSFAVPAGVTNVMVEATGGGGGAGGGACSSMGTAAGGTGGAPAYGKTIFAVTEGDTIDITIGTGGAGGTASTACVGSATAPAGSAGTATIIKKNSTPVMTAGGGSGGNGAMDPTMSMCATMSPTPGSPGTSGSISGGLFGAASLTGGGAGNAGCGSSGNGGNGSSGLAIVTFL